MNPQERYEIQFWFARSCLLHVSTQHKSEGFSKNIGNLWKCVGFAFCASFHQNHKPGSLLLRRVFFPSWGMLMMFGLAFPSCNHYTLKWNWNSLACLMVTQLIQITCVTWEFYGGISCDCLKRKEVRQLPFKPPWLYSGKGMLTPC